MNFFLKLFKTLRTKPWLRAGERPELVAPSGLRIVPGQVIGLYAFLLVAGSLFMLFTVSYQLRMDYQDWRPAPEPWQLWFTTLFLLAGSIMLQLAYNAGGKGDRSKAERLFQQAGILTWLFLLGQAWAWFAMSESGYQVGDNPANSFFYLITGVHAAHIAGGVVAWHRTRKKIQRGATSEDICLAMKLCAVYWHFLLLVWLLLFYMLLVS